MGTSWSTTGGPTLGESQYAVCPALQKMVLEERWEEFLVQRSHPEFELIDVDLSYNETDNPFRHEYRAATNSEIQSGCPMIILFPHQPDLKKKVLWTSDYHTMAALSGAIVDRLPSFKQVEIRGIQMVLLLDTRVIRVRGTMGTLYVLWLKKFNQINVNAQSSTILTNVPCIVEMNGQHSYRHLVVLTPEAGRHGNALKPLDLTHLTMEEDTKYPIYVREDDPRKHMPAPTSLVMRTTADAMQYVTSSGAEEHLDDHTPIFDATQDETDIVIVPQSLN